MTKNTATRNKESGFTFGNVATGNSMQHNKADFNVHYGIEDKSNATSTTTNTTKTTSQSQQQRSIAENTYKANECNGNKAGGSFPTGLCRPQH